MTTEPPIPTQTPADTPVPGSAQPGPTQPGPTQPGPTQPGPTQPGPAQPGPAQPGPEGQVPPQPAAPQPLPQHKIKRTRTSGLWVAVGFFAVILLLLLIFILQNGTQVSVSYMGAHGHLPLGVALLLAAVCGVLLVVLAGAARISQLRATARKHRRADAKRAAAVPARDAKTP